MAFGAGVSKLAVASRKAMSLVVGKFPFCQFDEVPKFPPETPVKSISDAQDRLV